MPKKVEIVVAAPAQQNTALALPATLTGEERRRLEGALLRLFNSLAPSSRVAYQRAWTAHVEALDAMGTDPMHSDPVHVEQWLMQLESEKRRGANARGNWLAIVRSIYAALARAGLRRDNPARESKVRGATLTSNTPFLTADELKTLLNLPAKSWGERRDRAMLYLFIGTGVRRETITAMLGGDHTPGNETRPGELFIRKSKGGKQFTVRLPKPVDRELQAWREFARIESDMPLFPSQTDGRAIGTVTVWTRVKAICARAEIDGGRATPHALRRSFATHAYLNGEPIENIQAALGHSTPQMTLRYVKAALSQFTTAGEGFMDSLLEPDAKGGEK